MGCVFTATVLQGNYWMCSNTGFTRCYGYPAHKVDDVRDLLSKINGSVRNTKSKIFDQVAQLKTKYPACESRVSVEYTIVPTKVDKNPR